MKLALGTAQFGSSYGIVNQFGMVNFQNVKEIIELAREKKIDLIDTAMAYGDSEKAIGKNNVFDFKVITKLPPVPENIEDVKSWVENKINLSLSNLGLSNLHGLLIHNSESLTGNSGKELINSLNIIKSKGLVKINNFKKNPNKISYLYILTPKGIAAKTELTIMFMKRKMAEYDELKKEISKMNK